MGSAILPENETEALRRRCAELERELSLLKAKQRARLGIAADAHRSLLPGPVRHDRIWVDVRYVPIEEVGGDYCQVRLPDRNTCYITVCDVMGHGVGAALLAARVSSEVRYGILYRRSPREIVRSLEQFMKEFFSRAELFFTFVAAELDLERMELTWCGAGHPSPFLIRPSTGEMRLLGSQNPLIGLGLPNSENPTQETVPLEPGDRLLFFTDGVFEVANADGRQLGMEGLASVARATVRHNLFDVSDAILGMVREYQCGPNADDQTLVVAELR